MKNVLAVMFGFLLGNFGWQLMSDNYDWALAAERTYFQALAVTGYLVTEAMTKKKNPQP